MTFNKTLLTLVFLSALPAAAADGNNGNVLPLDGVTRLADVAPRLPDAIAWCDSNLRTLKADARLSVQQRYDLKDCLYARYVSGQRKNNEGVMVRSFWEDVTRLNDVATDGQLVAAWKYPRTVKEPK